MQTPKFSVIASFHVAKSPEEPEYVTAVQFLK
jgi:hypothetical protein